MFLWPYISDVNVMSLIEIVCINPELIRFNWEDQKLMSPRPDTHIYAKINKYSQSNCVKTVSKVFDGRNVFYFLYRTANSDAKNSVSCAISYEAFFLFIHVMHDQVQE